MDPHLDEKGTHVMGHCAGFEMLRVDVDGYNYWFNPGFHQY